VRHSQNKRIWSQRVHRSASNGADNWVVLVDPSLVDTELGTYEYEYGNGGLSFDGENLHAWSINWGFVQQCVDMCRVLPTQTTRSSLLLNCTIDLKGWAFAYGADLPPTERKRYTSLITVSFTHYMPPP
jgi:hypothetical protein